MNGQHQTTPTGTSRRAVLSVGALAAATALGSVGLGGTAAAAPRGGRGRGPKAGVLFSESFDDVVRPTGYTHEAPKGWTTEAHGFRTGEGRWAGWTFTGVRDWTWAAGTDQRHYFTGGFGTFAVIESEHHRLDQESADTLNASLTTPKISLRGEDEIELAFDSHYRQGRPEQSAAVTASFDGGAAQDLVVYRADKYSSHEQLRVQVPAGASSVRFSWEYRNGHNDRWWAIDNIEVRVPLPALPADSAPLVTIDVVSDIHVSDSHDRYDRVVEQLNAMTLQAGALVINGDAVELGLQAHYDALAAALAGNPHRSGNVLLTVGNHEMLGAEGSDVYLARYLKVAGESTPYFERVVDGVPLIVVGTEYFGDREREGREPYNNFSDAQLAWLDGRLAHWRNKGQVVLLFNHFPLPYTVSQTHSSWEQNNYEDIDAFNAVVGKYTNILMFTGHTHDDLNLNDWWGTYRVADPKNPAGFPVVNTGAVLNAYVPDGDVDTARVDGDQSTGLRVHLFDDRIRVEAHDFVARGPIKFHDFALSALAGRG
ncbi:metallophosphoesterase [Georgenia ruanii]|uniref:Serine/threonine protein phosphatase n=1 Tax=Georgenia ruanii TaxID=348442 RepID=A0A7J9UX51_9MICO|nr:metallophosphoesterase [Georgenia ruanii]MPV89198.1 serine/threonine protein phosphatase [Georgenia ruanii]